MKIAIISNPRCGSKFFQLNLTRELRKRGDVAYLDYTDIYPADPKLMSLGEFFINDYKSHHNDSDDELYGIKKRSANEFYIDKVDYSSPSNLTLESFSRSAQLLDNVTLPFVVKMHYENMTNVGSSLELFEFYEKIDAFVFLTRSNLADWQVSRAITNYRRAHDPREATPAGEYKLDPGTNLEFDSIAYLQQLQAQTEKHWNDIMNSDLHALKFHFDVSNLPNIIKVGDLEFQNTDRKEYRNNHDYSTLKRT